MEWLGWIIAVVVVTFVSSQIAHAYSQPPESKSHFHTHLEKYAPVRTMDNIVAPFLLTGTRITPRTGSLTIEGHQPRVG